MRSGCTTITSFRWRAICGSIGFTGPIGFFLHTPFPHMQMLRLLPNHAELIRDLCQYDLVGFQTEDDVRSFRSCFERVGAPS